MEWAARRRLTVFLLLGALVFSVLLIIGFTFFYTPSSCSDGKQNQDETGIDCGGRCNQLCSADVRIPSIQFVRALQQSGRTDAIVYVENVNQSAEAKNALVTVELRGNDGALMGKASTRAYFPPASAIPLNVVPVFFPGVLSGQQAVRQAFATTTELTWIKSFTVLKPTVRVDQSTIQVQEGNEPRITAIVQNTTAKTQYQIPVIVTVFDTSGTAIAASQTLAATVPPQGSTRITFTWNEAFTAPVGRVDVVPILQAPK